MTEYTTDPEAIAHFLAARNRTANWVDSLSGKALVAPSVPPSLVSDTDDGLSSQDSDAESSHSLPPRMILRYPDGRPDVAVSTSGRGNNTSWPPKPTGTTPTYHSRSQPGSHGHHPSNPNIHSRAPSNIAPLYVIPPPPAPPIATHPETIHVRPTPPSPIIPQSNNPYFSSDPHNNSFTNRSRSMRSSRPPTLPLQMVYAPPPVPSSHSHSAPVSPTHEGFQHTQPPPPLPHPVHPVVAPPPLYGFPSASSPQEPPQVAPPTGSRRHSRTHSYSSNHSHPHPPASHLPNPGPPSSYNSGSAQRPRRHSSRAGSSHPDAPQFPQVDSQSGSHIGSGLNGISPTRRHGPPSIIYAPSVNSSSYAYNPPIITSHPPPSMTIHAPAPHHAHRMAPSISDPTPIGGSLGRNSTRGRLFEHFSRTPSPGTARARAKESKKKDKSRKDKSRRKQNDDGGADNEDDGASFSSGSTYYVLPGPGQKIRVVVSISLVVLVLSDS